MSYAGELPTIDGHTAVNVMPTDAVDRIVTLLSEIVVLAQSLSAEGCATRSRFSPCC
jgi:hypothetical protein